MSHIAPEEGSIGVPALAVIRGLTYTDPAQVFNRRLIPTYQLAFRWMGNRADSEEATAEVFSGLMGRLTLPAQVQPVNDQITDAAMRAVTGHWSDRYHVPTVHLSEISAAEAAVLTQPPSTLGALFDELPTEVRLVLVLRFLRKASLAAIGAQLGMRLAAVGSTMVTALTRVAERIGLPPSPGGIAQQERVIAFVDDLIAGARPARFDANQPAWLALVGATHVQAAIAGNDLPDRRFVRMIEQRLWTSRERRSVTSLRIWSA